MKIHACSQPRPCMLPPALQISKTMNRISFWRTWNCLMILQMVKRISWQQPNWFQQRQQMVFMSPSLLQLRRPWFPSALFMKALTILWKQKLKPRCFMKAWRSPAIPLVSKMILFTDLQLEKFSRCKTDKYPIKSLQTPSSKGHYSISTTGNCYFIWRTPELLTGPFIPIEFMTKIFETWW